MVVGDNELSFAVPSSATAGELFARFRLSTDGGLEPTGPAADGEVEDLSLTVLGPIDDSFVPREPISTSTDGAETVVAIDVDGEGDMDAVSASFFGNKIAWHENDGAENFTEHVLPTPSGSITHVVTAADIDGDGDIDLLSGSSGGSDKVAWYENDSAENFIECLLSADAEDAGSVFAADLDGDGDLDILKTWLHGDRIDWFENVLLDSGDRATLDFGDAPGPYPTPLAQDGARHLAVGPSFGKKRDTETDGSPSSLADGDEGGDGITIPSSLVVGRFNRIDFRIEAETAKIDAWIDFNGDGSFNEPVEQIAASARFDASAPFPIVGILITVPSTAIIGNTYARFRVSTAGGLSPTWLAADGEVEDYRVTVVAVPAASSLLAIGTEGLGSHETAPSSLRAARRYHFRERGSGRSDSSAVERKRMGIESRGRQAARRTERCSTSRGCGLSRRPSRT